MTHDMDTCMDLDCTACFPDYVPQVRDVVRDRSGLEWLVTFVGVSSRGKGMIMVLQHRREGHYADIPMLSGPSFPYGTYTRI